LLIFQPLFDNVFMTKPTNVLLFLLLLAAPAVAQFKNQRLDDPAAGQAYEPSVAINKKDPKNMVVSAYPGMIYYTADGGATWKKSQIPFSGPCAQGSLATDDKDTFYFFHLSAATGPSQIVVHQSSDGGATWSEGSVIEYTLAKDNRWLRVATDPKGSLLATWTQSDRYADASAECQSVVVYSKSSSGKKWSEPVTLSQMPGSCNEGSSMAAGASAGVSPDGKVYALWSRAGRLYMDRSYNGGGLWLSTDIPIVEQQGGWSFEVEGHPHHGNGQPQLVVDYASKSMMKGSVYVTYADQRHGHDDTDVWFIRSHNGGDNWTSPQRIGNNEAGKHQYMPAMAVDQTTGIIYIVYLDRGAYTDTQTDVYLAYSIDGGANFKTAKISEAPFIAEGAVPYGDYIAVAAHKGIITPVWTRIDQGKTSIYTVVIQQTQLIPETAPTKKK
jgi:hypothetical protein